MKIFLNNNIDNTLKHIKTSQKTAETKSSELKDTLEITSKKTLSQASFEQVLKKRLTSEVKSGVPENKVLDIKEQVALGDYSIDSASIARKMFF